jgi:serine beta-lactamase-like protein LACTB
MEVRMRRLGLMLVMAAVLSACTTAAPVADRYDAAIAAGREDVLALVAAQKVPGMSVAVAVDGAVVWAEGFGMADVEQSVAASPETRYRLGSVSKLFTAAMAARLAERGALDLDAPIQKYVPAFPDKGTPVTARQLLGHLAGVRHYRPTDPIFAGKTYPSLAAGLEIFSADPLLAPPGTAYTYTSYGYNLLGVVVENAAGKSFERTLTDEVTQPLGLTSLALDDPARLVPNRSSFYDTKDGAIVNAAPNDSSYKWPSGGLVASATDLVRFASAHLQPGFLSEPMLRTMFTPQRLASGQATNVGLGWRINTAEDGMRYFHHGGTIVGGRSFLLALPDHRVTVALVTNLLVRFDEKEALAIARRFVPPGRMEAAR